MKKVIKKATVTKKVKYSKPTVTVDSSYEGGSGGAAPILRISEVTMDFGREDLNQLRDKLNEIIRRI